MFKRSIMQPVPPEELTRKGYELLFLVSELKHVILVPHIYSDVDALSSAYVLYKVIKELTNTDVSIYIDKLSPYSPRDIYRVIKRENTITRKCDAPFIVLDASTKELLPKKLRNKKALAVIDHHKEHIQPIEAELSIISGLDSTTHMLYHMFSEFNVLSKKDILWVLAGMYEDTYGLVMHHHPNTIFEFGMLMKKAGVENINNIRKISLSDIRIQDLIEFSDSLKSYEEFTVGGIRAGYIVFEGSFPVEFADYLITKTKRDVFFVIHKATKAGIIYIRTNNGMFSDASELSSILAEQLETTGGGNRWRGVVRDIRELNRDWKNAFKKALLKLKHHSFKRCDTKKTHEQRKP